MKRIRYFLICFPFILVACNNSSEDKKLTSDTLVERAVDDTTGNAAAVAQNEEKKAVIERMAAQMKENEVMLNGDGINESIKQKWAKMDVARDSTGAIRRIKMYPHKGISERSEEFYYDNGKLFFVYISDHGIETENKDEGMPGKEFHFAGDRLVKYDDKSGDKENTGQDEELKLYQLKLIAESKELYALAESRK